MGVTAHLTNVNGQTVKAVHILDCDRNGCHTQIEWDAMPTAATQLPRKLDDIVEINHPKTGKKLICCCAECAILALNAGEHLPPKVELASSDQAKSVVADAAKVREMKVKR